MELKTLSVLCRLMSGAVVQARFRVNHPEVIYVTAKPIN